MLNVSLGDAAVIAVLGYAVVFAGLVLLMLVMIIMSKALNRSKAEAVESADVNAAVSEPVRDKQQVQPAPGSAGELKLYDTDPRDAAMIMAIVADTLGKPINELRFISIREVKE